MKSHEIFQQMSPALAGEILGFLNRAQRPVMKAAIEGLAAQRHLRPVFIERKSPNERAAWLQSALSRPANAPTATHLLHAWLVSAQKPMLCDFLDGLGIARSEDATVETLPASAPNDKLAEVIELLLAKYPPETVAVYLHAFHQMDAEVQWDSLGEILRLDQRLRIGAATPA